VRSVHCRNVYFRPCRIGHRRLRPRLNMPASTNAEAVSPANTPRTDGGDGATERITEPFDHTAVEWDRRLPMSQITFSIPDEILLALKATPEILAARIRIAAAVKLYEMGQLSSGAASQLAGVPKPYFLGHLADYGVNTFDLSDEELSHDLKSA
jgi:predicted HTH domain antitoxin